MAQKRSVFLTFRPATATDIPQLRDLAGCIWRGSYAGMISQEQIDYMLAWMYSPQKLAQELHEGVCWELALLDGAPVGFLALALHGDHDAELNKLYLLPAHHGRGLGQQMLAHSLTLARAHGCEELRLRVNKSNARALRAYERAGFRISEALVADIGAGFVMDDFVLTRRVP